MTLTCLDELIKILCTLRPTDTDETFYSDYISAVLGVFFTACRDLRELRHLVCFYLYMEHYIF